jgi:hypothetical protein
MEFFVNGIDQRRDERANHPARTMNGSDFVRAELHKVSKVLKAIGKVGFEAGFVNADHFQAPEWV